MTRQELVYIFAQVMEDCTDQDITYTIDIADRIVQALQDISDIEFQDDSIGH